MLIHRLKIGEFAKREVWTDRELMIKREGPNDFFYYEGTERKGKVAAKSICFIHNDFIKINKKETKMKDIKEIKVIVTTNIGCSEYFKTEEEALDYIADKLEDNPRTTFYMYKLYQKVQPERPDLSKLIIKCK